MRQHPAATQPKALTQGTRASEDTWRAQVARQVEGIKYFMEVFMLNIVKFAIFNEKAKIMPRQRVAEALENRQGIAPKHLGRAGVGAMEIA